MIFAQMNNDQNGRLVLAQEQFRENNTPIFQDLPERRSKFPSGAGNGCEFRQVSGKIGC